MAKIPLNDEESRIREMEQASEDEEFDEEVDDWEDWKAEGDEEEEEDSRTNAQCLFCDSEFNSCDALFSHCSSDHHFDFRGLRKGLGLDFYGAFKFINYVRSQVAENRCWSCGQACYSNQELQEHLHEIVCLKDIKTLWDDDKYLKPFIQEDSLLYSFAEDDEEGEDDYDTPVDKDEIMKHFRKFEDINIDDEYILDPSRRKDDACASNGHLSTADASKKDIVNGLGEDITSSDCISTDKKVRVSFAKLTAKDIKNVNENYFGSYSSFGIHREMLSDKVRMDAYGQAILKNPSLLNGAVVMDVGCGTGILSFFAARAGASRVIAVEASEKMAAVATQIAKVNGLWRSKSPNEINDQCTGVVEVVQGMVEELEKSIDIQPHSLDVLLSEWMGYCLLYESMLNSVLFARDHWLKPGGAMLPDTATIFVAGFGRGGTSLPFWEDVYGFDMTSVGKEIFQDSAQIPIVDVVDGRDIVTDAAVLQTFNLVTMKHDDVDFTTQMELEPKADNPPGNSVDSEPKPTWCYGVVLWFETGFTSRFCKEMPAVLSTSPYTPKTHWSQTIFTFQEPIAIAPGKPKTDKSASVGTKACPAVKIPLRISIARATEHRSIDISLEAAGVSSDGRKHSWPVQIFNLA